MMLSIYDNPEYIQRALEAGALGYVLKEDLGNDLFAAIHALYRGKQYFSQKIAEIAKQFIAQKGNDTWAD
jgi:DNA-binding NarL/FixJ family response regulator